MMIDEDPAQASTLPASWYGGQTQWECERRAIFGREWLMVGRDVELPEPGSYLTDIIVGWPIFVIRDREGRLRGFHNVCRHRAGPIVWDGKGQCDVLRCRYHGWVYDTDGNLRQTPEFGDPAGFDKQDYGLFPIQAGVWRGLVFVNLDLAALPLDLAMAGLSAETAPWPMESYSFHSRAEHDIACNWKAYVDNYAEGYHVKEIHPSLNQEIDAKGYQVILKDRHAVHQAPSRQGANYAGLWLWRFPNLAINIYAAGMNIECMVPLGPDRTRLVYNFFFHDMSAASEPAIQAVIAMSSEVTQEDIRICEAVQRNLNSGLYETGRLSPRQESGVLHFQNLVRDALN